MNSTTSNASGYVHWDTPFKNHIGQCANIIVVGRFFFYSVSVVVFLDLLPLAQFTK